MTLTKDQIRAAALRLDPVERETLADDLLQSLNEDDRDRIDAAWLAEVGRRDQAFRADPSRAKPVSEVIGRLQRRGRQ